MCPVDELLAFLKLLESGHCVAEIAARFGVSETVVQQRLALARVSPVLLQQYREGELNLELLQAFTLTDDHTRQEQIWQELPSWNRKAATIRHLLSQEALPATNKPVRLGGIAAYEAAGRRVNRDLFAEDEAGVFLLDSALL